MNRIYAELYNSITQNDCVPSRGGLMYELLGTSFKVEPDSNLVTLPWRKMSPVYANAELLWYLSEKANVQMISSYAPQYAAFAEDNGTAYGAYGTRWGETKQLPKVLELLEAQPDTRRAILSMWRASDLDNQNKLDLPCTLALQFLIRNNALHCIAYMRSNDLWLGTPNDVYCFTSLQRIIADYLGMDVGTYTHSVGSLHLYTSDAKKMQDGCLQRLPYKVEETKHGYKAGSCKTIISDIDLAVKAELYARGGIFNSDLYAAIQSDTLRDAALMCLWHWQPLRRAYVQVKLTSIMLTEWVEYSFKQA